jgi:predicted membrane channel-forming protein YqfA (hemolysin III family)
MSKYENRIGNIDKSTWYKMLQDILHHLFTLLMGILLTVLFSPIYSAKTVCVDGHTKLFLYAFGVLSIIGIIQHFIEDRREKRE